jgi:MoaA/NifB/PqqE/SkfB family radical SAM enzyme
MNIPHDTFCVLPWISLEASPVGTVRPCCLAMDEITNDNGDKFKLASTGLVEIQNSQAMQTLREDFLAGKKPQTCRRCWNEERAGRTSKRMHTLDRLKHMIDRDVSWTADAMPLMFLDLKLGNICNLKCRICGSWSSSQFAAEEIKYNRAEETRGSFAYQMLKDGAWPRESAEFWTDLDRHLDNIRYIEFTGGEPFMIKEHFQLLQKLVDTGRAAQVEIHYNTNGTQYPEEGEAIWKHFKHVEIAVSIDDVEERFEYQRSNAVWTEVVENVERFRQLRSRNSNIALQACCTINVFNVYYLETVANWLIQQGFDFIYWNMMHDAYYFSISTLPETAKAAIAQRLTTATVPPRVLKEFVSAAEFMNRGNSLDGNLLRMNLRDLDYKRKQNLADVAPEFAALIDYDYNKT